MGSDKGSSIPDFGKYMSSSKGENKNKLFSYFMVGTMGALSAAGAKSTVQGMDAIVTAVEGHRGIAHTVALRPRESFIQRLILTSVGCRVPRQHVCLG